MDPVVSQEEVVEIDKTTITCKKCGRHDVPPDPHNRHICVDCARAENNRVSYYRQHQTDWMLECSAAGLDPWVRQPRETQWEYSVWCAFRDTYPGKPMSYSDLAESLGTTRAVVGKIAQRWTFAARMQAWVAYTDKVTMAQRRSEIVEMNGKHIKMAQALNAKIEKVIDNIDPSTVKPAELASLMRTAAELERKARVDTVAQDEMMRDIGTYNESGDAKGRKTKASDLGEVVDILAKAGVLQQMRMTTTTTTTVEPADTVVDCEVLD